MILTSMPNNIQYKKNDKVEGLRGNSQKDQPLQQMTKIPYDLKKIQPRAMKAWNCDKNGSNINGKCRMVICTYKLLPG